MTERRVCVQADRSYRDPATRRMVFPPRGTITWSEHCEVWDAYAKRGHGAQSAERIVERGGFGKAEAEMLLGRPLRTWEPRR